MATDPAEQAQITLAHKLAEKKAAKNKAFRDAEPVRAAINGRGKVAVFHLHDQKVVQLWPIDAQELLAAGRASLDTIDLIGSDGQSVKCGTEQVEDMFEKGYKLASEAGTVGKTDEKQVSKKDKQSKV